MSNVFDRFSKVAKAEWNHLVRRRPSDDLGKDADAASQREAEDAAHGPPRVRATSAVGAKAVADVEGALRVLELSRGATLDEVRARYRELARRYQPKTQSRRSDEAEAAHTVMLALTDALELLEEHLLPLP